MKKGLLFAFIIAFTITFEVSLFAQSNVGKLSGKIVDANTLEPLIGANIILLGTEQGAATDVNGQYFILNIEPGTYDVRVSYVGYGEKIIQEIRIVGGITYELNVSLSAGIELREIVVTDKKLFEEKATNTVKVLDSDQISQLPVRGVEQLVSLQAGVVVSEGSGGAGGNATLNVRGGRGSEVTFIVDGIVQNDPLWGQNFSQVSNSAIEQLSFQVGGFEAKYGQSQSGIVSVTTKAGSPSYSIYSDVSTSSFTDDYGSNLYTINLSGPLYPGQKDHTIFLSAERGWFLDGNPSAQGINFASTGYSSPVFPGKSEGLWRYTGKITSNLGNQFTLRLGANYNTRDFRGNVVGNGLGSTLAEADYSFAKNNSDHIGKILRDNLSLTAKLSQNVGSNSFYDITFGYKTYYQEQGDGVFFNNLEAYGDTLTNPFMPVQGDDATLAQDKAGIFAAQGYLENYYRKINNKTYSADISFTSQLQNHLLEFGGGFNYNIMRYFRMLPSRLAFRNRDYISPNGDTTLALSRQQRYEDRHSQRYGYDIYGNEIGSGSDLAPKTPILGYGYLQDRFELQDLVLNLGIRFDYFATKSRIFKNPSLPYAGGTNPNDFDDGDFITKKPEFYVSPRIGLGFPVTATTVFHAQFGRFIQEPRLLDAILFESRNYLLQQTDNFQFNNGEINSEKTTQYEIGFRQILGNNTAAINITAFYKNIQDLTNTEASYWYRQEGGQRLIIFGATNTDFGTVRGLALTVDIPRISYFALSLNYTYSLAEGTGSSTNSSYTAAFRNVGGEIPKVIAPLDFDQRHTGIVNVNFNVPAGELGIFELISANVLISFNSGRPYTPLDNQDLTENYTNYGQTKGYLNSAYGPGNFRVDFKLEKSFKIGDLFLSPYLWVQNLFDAQNAVQVWRSTGSPTTTGFLDTEAGKTKSIGYGEKWTQDYMSLERDPSNFGIPRLINLGIKVNFSNL